MSDDNKPNPDSFKQSIIKNFNTSEIILFIASLIVIFGSFLNWMENPLVSTTGIGTELGYVTIIISIFVMILAYTNKYQNKRMILSFLAGLGLLIVASAAILIIFTEPQVRTGGGLYLTLAGTIIIIFHSVKKYADLTSAKRTMNLVTGTLLLAIFVPSLIFVGGTLFDQYQKDQAEQDLEDLEINQVQSYHSHGNNHMIAELELHNPTNNEISVYVYYTSDNYNFEIKKVSISPGNTDTAEISVDSSSHATSTGRESATECEKERIEFSEGFYYNYSCDEDYLRVSADYNYDLKGVGADTNSEYNRGELTQ